MVGVPNRLVQQYFDSADVIMIAISSDEKVVDINRKGCEILGCSKDEVIGKNWFDFFVHALWPPHIVPFVDGAKLRTFQHISHIELFNVFDHSVYSIG